VALKLEFKRAEYVSPGKRGKSGFEDLEAYKLALDVMINAHEVARHLPPQEKYELTSQIRRSSKSVVANIAEGYGRYHYLDSLRHYSIARGELNETLSHFITAKVLGYIEPDYFEQIHALIRQTEAALNGFMTYVRKQRTGSAEFGDKAVREEPAIYDSD
jgi:four helix bundle protein